MTREEAIEELERLLRHWDLIDEGIYDLSEHDKDAVDLALSALRPVSREQVEKVFPGCRSCKSCRSCVFSIHAIKDMPCKKCDPNAEGVLTEYKPSKFCPVCGKPLTDEAVQMVMERMEALKDGKGD